MSTRTLPTGEGISTTRARKDFSELINRVTYGDEEITITRHGEPLVALISAERLAELEAIEDAMDGLAAEKAAEEGDFEDADAFFAEMEKSEA